jgi:hypothetical protein
MLRFICVAALIVLLSYRAHAEAPDLSTPKKAAVAFAQDLESGDLAAARAASVGSEEDFKLIEIISGMVRSARDLRSSAIDKFGDEGKQAVPAGEELAEIAKRVGEGVEKITGDTATVGQPNEQDPMKLKKVAEGSWRVDLSSIPDKDEIRKTMPKVQKIFSAGAADIKSGKYKTSEDARNAISDQMFAAISQPAASRPADGVKK